MRSKQLCVATPPGREWSGGQCGFFWPLPRCGPTQKQPSHHHISFFHGGTCTWEAVTEPSSSLSLSRVCALVWRPTSWATTPAWLVFALCLCKAVCVWPLKATAICWPSVSTPLQAQALTSAVPLPPPPTIAPTPQTTTQAGAGSGPAAPAFDFDSLPALVLKRWTVAALDKAYLGTEGIPVATIPVRSKDSPPNVPKYGATYLPHIVEEARKGVAGAWEEVCKHWGHGYVAARTRRGGAACECTC